MAFQDFLDAYIECALWSSTDDGDLPLDDNYGVSDLSPELRSAMEKDCREFYERHNDDLQKCTHNRYSAEELGGHELWLSRNGHGSCFLDGDWPCESARRLMEAAWKMGEVYLYVGDDGLIRAS